MLVTRSENCSECGYPIDTSLSNAVYICQACRTAYENRNQSISSMLVFEELEKNNRYELITDITLARNEDMLLGVYYTENKRMDKRFSVDSVSVSNPHAEVIVKEVKELQDEGEVRRVLLKKLCFIRDVSRYGTEVNGVMLRKDDDRLLMHGDRIVLAPLQAKPVKITYQEEIKTR